MKDFIIISNQNAISYKLIFPLIKNLGIRVGSRVNTFIYEGNEFDISACWLSTLNVLPYPEFFKCSYSIKDLDYKSYDNFDAIDVPKAVYIPKDYDGMMGVPLTFIYNWNPNQFEILGIDKRFSDLRTKYYTIDDGLDYNDLNGCSVIKEGKELKKVFTRLLLRHRKK